MRRIAQGRWYAVRGAVLTSERADDGALAVEPEAGGRLFAPNVTRSHAMYWAQRFELANGILFAETKANKFIS